MDKSQVESLLLVSPRPLGVSDLIKFFKKSGQKTSKEEIKKALDELVLKHNAPNSGINIVYSNDSYQMVSNPANKELAEQLIKQERSGELTQPSIETLTIIAYRGPISKAEIEKIRGVNCSLILRNLMIRGLADFEIDKNNGQELYSVTVEFLQYLGLNTVEDLPDYSRLHQLESLVDFLANKEESLTK
ncbi:MAG TPA: SMC-Scp complex subunit ScpB [Candidatus Bipolaricaulota bacterium]|nr:SMC-Scp complex subunit ScpB [Candidatus Bipolaricaulota bacterium]